MSKLAELVKEMEGSKKEWVDRARNLFMASVNEMFEKYPTLNNISWPQYTPYFNDGDECIFSVHSYGANVNGAGSELNDDQEVEPDLVPAHKELENLLDAVPGDLMKDIFGDHNEVTIHRTGKIEKERYDHD